MKIAKNRAVLVDVWHFLKVRKAWWLLPIIIMLLLVGTVITVASSPAGAPFIYPLL